MKRPAVLCVMFMLAACGRGELYSSCVEQDGMTREACACLQDEADAVLDEDGERFVAVLMWGDSDARDENKFEDLPRTSMDGVSDFLPAINKCGVGIRTNYLGL